MVDLEVFYVFGYLFCDSNCPSIVTFPRHVSHPSVFAFSYVPDNVCHTTLFPDPICTLSVLKGDSDHDSLHFPLSCDQLLKLGVAKRPGLTARCHYFEGEYGFVSTHYLHLIEQSCCVEKIKGIKSIWSVKRKTLKPKYLREQRIKSKKLSFA